MSVRSQVPNCSSQSQTRPLPVASNLRFLIFLSLEAFYMRYDMKECGNRIRQIRKT